MALCAGAAGRNWRRASITPLSTTKVPRYFGPPCTAFSAMASIGVPPVEISPFEISPVEILPIA
jgi:hypothetical protein